MAERRPKGATFGELVESSGTLQAASVVTREVIGRSNAEAAEQARVHLLVISCDTCTATKACCWFVTAAYLYEVLPIVARLIREQRNTPELRRQLLHAAEAMETTSARDYRRPCLFLDADERCTIYEDRPNVCGTHLVSSPAEQCALPDAKIEKFVTPLQDAAAPQFASLVVDKLGLEPIGMPYFGAMPRMVLLCLDAWPRRDYVRYLARHGKAAAERYQRS